ncbi:MAG: DUF1003 domain-containing protein [Actinobacteria bacterium]|nr:DUF1003 domain-containing protein [Actinomycetota bacterium]
MEPTPEHLLQRVQRLRLKRRSVPTPRTRDVVGEFDVQLTPGERIADAFAVTVGSWRFIIIQSALLAAWLILNLVGWLKHWDPYPFILLNLMLSFQAAYAAPIIMMSQNRTSELDRLQARNDFEVNQRAEVEIEEVLTLLESHTLMLREIQKRLSAAPETP